MSSTFWVIVAGVFLVLELVIPGLVTVWFGLAGIVMYFFSTFDKGCECGVLCICRNLIRIASSYKTYSEEISL